ncbi:MAG TPA: glutamate formimidoyltransferase [candidate division Zixibacteria bacterium]|nr:glutamate formimidoyltransferase [candidate division Zixibacteria bacterium]
MAKLVEVIPNFSEGRRPEVLQQILDEITSVKGCVLLDKEMDADHNRAVVTYVAPPDAAVEAAFRAMKKASEVIDLRTHKGEHPRMGATDVVPFVPISEVSQEEAIALAKQLAERVANELEIPIYLYEDAATRPERVNLADIRKGEYEVIAREIETLPERKPDYGPSKIHPRAGCTAVGVRFPLIAFNVYLNTPDVSVAKKIAKAIRSNWGGYAYCKALGFEIKDRNMAQVSMNLVNYLRTPIYRVFNTIESEATRWGTSIYSSEVVGLVPNQALINCAKHYLRLENFTKDQILEEKLQQASEQASREGGIKDFIEAVASQAPAPGGGSVSACAGSLAAALAGMVCRLTVNKKKYADVKDEISEVMMRADGLKEALFNLISDDAKAFDDVMAAMKMPKDTDKMKAEREQAIQKATIQATRIPLKVMELSYEAIKCSQIVAEKGNVNSLSDAGVSSLAGRTAVIGAYMNVKINIPGIEDDKVKTEIQEKAEKIRKDAVELAQKIENDVISKL